jgi:hypothetical protein
MSTPPPKRNKTNKKLYFYSYFNSDDGGVLVISSLLSLFQQFIVDLSRAKHEGIGTKILKEGGEKKKKQIKK